MVRRKTFVIGAGMAHGAPTALNSKETDEARKRERQ